jgi:cellulose biosynthesis protein BcsQ
MATQKHDPQNDSSPAAETSTRQAGNGSRPDGQDTVKITIPRENHDLTFNISSGAADADCKLIAFLSPKGGSGKTVLASNLGKLLQMCGYNVLLLDADFTTKSMTNLIFPGRKVIREGLISYYKGLLGLDGVEIQSWVEGVKDGSHILPIDTSDGKRIDILPSYYSKEQQISISTNIFLRESRSHNLSSVVERFSLLIAGIKSLKRYDYIIVDCASAFDDIGLSASILAPYVVIVSEADDISFESMDDTLRYALPFTSSNALKGEYRLKQPFICLNKDPNLRPGEKTARRASFHCKYIPDIHKNFGRKSFLVPDIIEDVEFEYQLYRLWRKISEWSTNPDETFTETAYHRLLQLEKVRNIQIERYWNADLQYRKRNVMFGLSVLLIASTWVGAFGYVKPALSAMTTAASGLGLFMSSVILYGVWEYFEKGIRALKHELYIDVNEKREEHHAFVAELSGLVKARENSHRQTESARASQAEKRSSAPASKEQDSVAAK